MRQLYWMCRAGGIVRGFRQYFVKGTTLTECEIEILREIIKL